MALTGKDLIATVLAAGTFGVYYVQSKGLDVPVLSNGRLSILILGILGIAMCTQQSGVTDKNVVMYVATGLGILSLIFVVYGLIVGTKTSVTLLAGTILLLWLISTLRHLLTK